MAVHSDFAAVVKSMVTEGMTHPFRQKVYEGRATRADLAVFAVQTYHRNLYSSRFASANHSRCPIPEIRRALLEVSVEEELQGPGERPSHAELMMIFAEALGIRRADIIESRPLPGTLVFIDTIMQLSQGHWLEGMAFRASEINAPSGSTRWLKSMQEHYGFPADVLGWWSTHATVDVEHGNISLEAYGKHAREECEQTMSVRAIERMQAAWRVFFDGIMEAGEAALRGEDVGFPLPAGVR